MPKSINESINFNEEDYEPMDDYEGEEEIPEDEPEVEGEGMDVMAFVDDIRKKSLKGMAALAENPDDERYQLLKKIWQICDKKPEQQTAFNNPNNQMQGQTLGATVQKAVNEGLLDFFKKKDKKDYSHEESEYEKERWEKEMKKAAQAKADKRESEKRKYGSSNPFDSKVSGWKSDGLYHDPVGVTHTDDSAKDWMYGDR